MVEEIRQGDIPGVQLRYRHQLPGTANEVWRWLTETDRLSVWLCQRARTDKEREKAILLESTTENGPSLRERIDWVRDEPPHRWIVDFQRLGAGWPTPTRLTFELTPYAEGTELSVLQTGFAHLPLSDCLTIWETYRHRWRTALARLAEAMTTHQDR